MPREPEATALLALMLLHDSRRAARTGADGELVLLDRQDRSPLGPRARSPRGSTLVGEARGRRAASVHDPGGDRRGARAAPSAPRRRTGRGSPASTPGSPRSTPRRWSSSTAPSPSRWPTARGRAGADRRDRRPRRLRALPRRPCRPPAAARAAAEAAPGLRSRDRARARTRWSGPSSSGASPRCGPANLAADANDARGTRGDPRQALGGDREGLPGDGLSRRGVRAARRRRRRAAEDRALPAGAARLRGRSGLRSFAERVGLAPRRPWSPSAGPPS